MLINISEKTASIKGMILPAAEAHNPTATPHCQSPSHDVQAQAEVDTIPHPVAQA
jgi:hypothetical protein